MKALAVHVIVDLHGCPFELLDDVPKLREALRKAAGIAKTTVLEEAFSKLDFLVAVDFYINETTRHAHIILPTPSPAEQANYEVGLYLLSVRNVAKWSWAAVPPPEGTPETWQVMSNLAASLMGLGGVPEKDVDDFILRRFTEAVEMMNEADEPAMS